MKNEMSNIIQSELSSLLIELKENGKINDKDYKDLYAYLKKICILLYTNKDNSPNRIFDLIIEDYLKAVKGISILVPGLATSIKDDKSGIILETYSGKTTNYGEVIDEETRFDLASVTKMFTSIEFLKLQELGIIDSKQTIKDLSNGKYDLNFPISELPRFARVLKTNGRIDEDISREEFEKRLHNSYLDENEVFKYSDIPFIILKDLMPDDDYFKKFYKEEMGLLNTSYERYGKMTGGNYTSIDLPYDPKARNMMKFGYKEPGHAGVFSTSRDLVMLYDNLKSGFLSKESIKNLITKAYKDDVIRLPGGNEININRAMGVYVKHSSGLKHSDVVPILSDEAFSIDGSSGTYTTYDLKNGLTANFLGNPFSRKEDKIIEVDNSEYTLKDTDSPFFDNGTLIKLCGKTLVLLDKKGDPITIVKDGKVVEDKNGNDEKVTISYSNITNTLKTMQIYTLLALRLSNKVLYKKARLESDDYSRKVLDESGLGNNTRMIKKL